MQENHSKKIPIRKDVPKLKNPGLRAYLDEIAMRHMTVHFLGLPHLKEEGVLSLEQIYIPITFTDQYKGRDPDVPRTSLIQLMKDHQRVVILGDPGTGKSTLIKHIAYSFARERETPLQHHFGNLIPVPIILRDFALRDIKDAEGLIKSFWENLWRNKKPPMEFKDFKKILDSGEAIFLLDGLDEKGDKDRRKHLRYLTASINKQFPDARMLLTSRIVGYDEVPFDFLPVSDKSDVLERISNRDSDLALSMFHEKAAKHKSVGPGGISTDLLSLTSWPDGEQVGFVTIHRFYIAPFSNDEIDAFVDKWYAAKEQDEQERARKNKNLKQAIRENQNILDLARVPNLLTLMALVNFIYAHLPSGRGKLYDKITEAYLESIDKYRGILTYPVPLESKKKWMAHVGFWMQERRTQNERGGKTNKKEEQSEILVSRQELLKELETVMTHDLGAEAAAQSAPRFLTYISERSGLLIPRGPEEYAFVHLSFQEYFAAVHLYQRVFEFDKLKTHIIDNLPFRSWHETFILLFELLSISQSGACSSLLEAILEAAAADKQSKDQALAHGAAGFLSELLLDLETGLRRADQQRAINFCVRYMAESDIDNSILYKLHNLNILDNEELRREAVAELLEAGPENLPDKTMLVAPLVLLDSDVWFHQLDHYLQHHKDGFWSANVLADVMPWAILSDTLLGIGISSLPLPHWFANYGRYYSISLSDILHDRIVTVCMQSSRYMALRWASALRELAWSNVFRVYTTDNNTSALDLAHSRSLDRALDFVQSQTLNRSVIRFHSRSRALDLIPYVSRTLALARTLALDFALSRPRSRALGLAGALNKINDKPIIVITSDISGWMRHGAEAINMLYSTKQADSVLVGNLTRMAQNPDNQPERLLARVALIALGLGGRGMVEEVNREVAGLYLNGADPSQWPEEFGSGDPEFFSVMMKELRECLPDVFLFESDDKPQSALLNPDFYDPDKPESKYFLMTPDKFWPEYMQWVEDIAEGRIKLAD